MADQSKYWLSSGTVNTIPVDIFPREKLPGRYQRYSYGKRLVELSCIGISCCTNHEDISIGQLVRATKNMVCISKLHLFRQVSS